MASNFKLILLCILILCFFNFPITNAQDPNPTFLYQNCTANKTTANSIYQMDIRILLSSLSSNATTKTFYNTTVGSRNSSDTVYGLFMCRGDVPSQLCRQCVVNATQKLSSDSECSLSKQAVIWYDECMVRYSNISFFTAVALRPGAFMWNTANISNEESFRRLLSDTMNQTADEAANSPTGNRYATKEANISEFQRLYCLAQCTQDLSPQACTTCFADAIGLLPRCCEGKQGGRVLLASCNIRYELYPFYRVTNETTGGLVPETKYPQIDSKYSEDPGYISHNCSSNETIAADSAFQSNLKTLLSELSSNATGGNEFQIEVGTLYGLFTCRGDIPRRLCGLCVQNATEKIVSECRLSREAIIWYNHCWLRYSHRNFFSTVDTSPRFERLNITNSFSIAQNSFSFTLSTNLAKMANEAGNKGERYQTGTLKLNDYQTLYILAQCTRDLSSNDCGGCLRDVIGSSIPWSRLGSVGGRVLYPSCNLRFEPFKFYDLMPDPATPPPTGKRKSRSQTIILIVVPIAIGLAILLSCGCYFLRGKIRKNYRTILRENFGDESTILEPLQFNLTIIKAATNNFSHVNKIGKGGFGEVFKGILIDGRHIAVKRLSTTSRQGVEEFKNEILLIAKLQHRNLVAFIGFCLDEQEKILIYEYVPNKSLDYFLFDTKAQKVLSWSERYKIIGGIARGILYLHEYSRLKVIHRDLKPSNILLDENMNPKISDFGLARIIEIDQQEGSTNRIIGTYGYMSPEYAILGQFSEKSDVFSFGVMILEIITGKKNIGSYESHHVRDGLLSYAWRQWKDQEPLNILDPKLRENYSEIEVTKCIQLGLLCVQENPDARPTMVALVSYLSSHSIELPFPQEPAFFMHDRMDLNIVAQESSSSQSANSSIPLSINEMSISKFYPR